MQDFDVVIVGAGPAGCAGALELGKSRAKVLLLDREPFPRDKVCGDAIPGPAVKALAKIDPGYAASLAQLPAAARSRRTRLCLNGHRPVDLTWETRAYTCRRTDFDAHLLGLVRKHTATKIRTGVRVNRLHLNDAGVVIQTDGGPVHAKLVIGADGAHSVVGKQLAGHRLDLDHHGGAVRQYHRGVADTEPDRLEIHTLPEFMPGYFWIFPLTDGYCNVGFGMHSRAIKRKGLALRTSIQSFIAASPSLRERFADATATEAARGFGLPFGSRRVTVSGDRFLLAGDAAQLIDPLTGDGIGQAVHSGWLAGRRAVACLRENDFSAGATADYTVELRRQLGRDLRFRSAVLDAHRRMPFLVDWGARLMSVNAVRDFVRPRL